MSTTTIFVTPAKALKVKGRTVRDFTNVETIYRKSLRTISLKVRGDIMSVDDLRLRVLTPRDLAGVLNAIYALYDDDQEHLVMIVISSDGSITGFKRISTGAQDYAMADARVIYRNALMLGAAAIILSHNHPSGDTMPSNNDIEMTRKLAQAGELMNVELLDHIIYTSKKQLSLKETMRELFVG